MTERWALIESVMNRSIARGEINGARLSRRIANLPFDLVRHEVLMTMHPVSVSTIEEIVDTIFLPLVAQHRRTSHEDRDSC
jgi:CO dehydrogenase/acetyl-CoA synthase delta subunit